MLENTELNRVITLVMRERDIENKVSKQKEKLLKQRQKLKTKL
ncbi:hypothetical protein [Staphylococcus felis]|nr:hypothetical protein [Staphylococcus felis]